MKPPRLYLEDERLHLPTLTVYERDTGQVDTGLLDASGDKIMRTQPMGAIGFDMTGKPRVRVKARSERTR